MSIFASIISYLEQLATQIPLELFALVGTFLEEVIAPIPSPLVMTLTGSITKAQQDPISYIFVIALIGAVGKTLGAWVIYVISDKAEDIILGKLGNFFGVSHKQVESFGKRFNGTWKDGVTIAFLRALPVMSTALVSTGCGIVKINLKTYIISSFLGNIIRNIFFLYLGYTGLAASKEISQGLESTATILKIVAIILLLGLIGYGYYKRAKNEAKEENQ